MNNFGVKLTILLLFVMGAGVFLVLNAGFGETAYPQATFSLTKPTFAGHEPIVTTIRLNQEQAHFPSLVTKAFAQESYPFKISYSDPEGKTASLETEVNKQNDQTYTVTTKPGTTFKPGTYEMKVTFTEGLARRDLTQNFSWGVLAFNIPKNPTINQEVPVAIAVLNESGEMVCRADVTLTITAPDGSIEKKTTTNGTLTATPFCPLYEITPEPDYKTSFVPTKQGAYTLELTATTENGSHTISEEITVTDKKDITLERDMNTRIYPKDSYPVTINVESNTDQKVTISEKVPLTFTVLKASDAAEFTIEKSDGWQELHWEVDLKQGEPLKLSYRYDAPDISPEFYLLGPIQIHNGESLVFAESRQWQIASDAVSLEYYYNSNTASDTSTSTTYVSHTTTTVDRSAYPGSKTFFVIGHISLNTSATSTFPQARLLQDGSTTLGEVNSGITLSDASSAIGSGISFNFIKEVTLDNSSHNFAIQFARQGGSGTITAINSSVIVIEKSANAFSAEQVAEVATGANTGLITALELQFSATAGDYVLVWAAETLYEDEDSTGRDIRFSHTTDAVVYSSAGDGDLVSSANDNDWFTVGGFAYDTLSSGTNTFRIEIDGAGSLDETKLQRGTILAIPTSDFLNAYLDSQTVGTIHNGQSFTDSDVSITQNVNAAKHLILGGVEVSNDVGSGVGSWQLASDGTNFPLNNLGDRDADVPTVYQYLGVHGASLTSGSKTFSVQGRSESTSSTLDGRINRAYLAVLEVDATDPPPTPTPTNTPTPTPIPGELKFEGVGLEGVEIN